jgi:hypothetical protein
MTVGSSNLSIGGHRISLVGDFFVTVTMRSLLSWYQVPSYAACCSEDSSEDRAKPGVGHWDNVKSPSRLL